jgi:BirA family biotin operon repressor/biotin-[acetyl-CoA-carboxylase] ligase
VTPAAWPEGHDRLILDEAPSTQDLARAEARAGRPGPLWIMARRQTAGRGRRGRVWTAPPGNLSCTLMLRPKLPAKAAAGYGFVAALAMGDLVSAAAPGREVRLKWPNDVVLEGGKAAGVLIESEGSGAAVAWMAIGIGVNLAAAPPADPEAALPPISVAATGATPPAPEDALTVLAAAFARHAARFEAEGFAPIREAWLARAFRLGERIEARLPAETVTGRFADLDADGSLVLHVAGAVRRIPAADVHFPAA